jgi:hypothetical protein
MIATRSRLSFIVMAAFVTAWLAASGSALAEPARPVAKATWSTHVGQVTRYSYVKPGKSPNVQYHQRYQIKIGGVTLPLPEFIGARLLRRAEVKGKVQFSGDMKGIDGPTWRRGVRP